MAEGIRDQLGVDLVLLSSGSIRKPELGPIVTLKDYIEVFPFNDCVYSFKFTGNQLRHEIRFMLRDKSFVDSGHTEWYQFSRGFFCEYDRPTHSILSLKMNGKEVNDADLFTVAMQEYHFKSISEFLDVRPDEIEKNGQPQKVATSTPNVQQEYFIRHNHIEYDSEQRLIIHE